MEPTGVTGDDNTLFVVLSTCLLFLTTTDVFMQWHTKPISKPVSQSC